MHAYNEQGYIMVMTVKERIVSLLNSSDGPLTDEEIAEILEVSPNTARPRRVELEQDGIVVAGGMKLTKSGREAYCWTTEEKLDKIINKGKRK